MKKYYIIVLLALLAIFIGCYAAFEDFNYEVDMLVFHILDKGDGLYCSPNRCVDIIHDYSTLYHESMSYMKLYGPEDPGRPSANYKWDSTLHAYIKFIKW